MTENPAADLARKKWAALKGKKRTAATAAARKAVSSRTPEQRAESARKGWRTRKGAGP